MDFPHERKFLIFYSICQILPYGKNIIWEVN